MEERIYIYKQSRRREKEGEQCIWKRQGSKAITVLRVPLFHRLQRPRRLACSVTSLRLKFKGSRTLLPKRHLMESQREVIKNAWTELDCDSGPRAFHLWLYEREKDREYSVCIYIYILPLRCEWTFLYLWQLNKWKTMLREKINKTLFFIQCKNLPTRN